MNAFVQSALAQYTADDWYRQRPVLYAPVPSEPAGRVVCFGYGDLAPAWASAKYVCENEDLRGTVAVYPTSAAVLLPDVNWFWEGEHEVRQGTARACVRYCQRKGLDPNTFFPVDPDRVHGTYVRYEGAREDGRDYRLVLALAFPSACYSGWGRSL